MKHFARITCHAAALRREIFVSFLVFAAVGQAGPKFLGVDFEEAPKWEYASSSIAHVINHGCRTYSSRHVKIPLKEPYLGFKEMELSSADPEAQSPIGGIALKRYVKITNLERDNQCAATWTSNAVERLTMEYGVPMRPREDFAREFCGTNAALEFRCGTSACSTTINDNPPIEEMHYYIYVRMLNVKKGNDIYEPSQSDGDRKSPRNYSPKADIEVEVDI